MKTYRNAFELSSNDPSHVKLMEEKARLLILIRDNINNAGVSQSEAASYIECTQPRLSRLINGQISEFSLDWLFLASDRLLEGIKKPQQARAKQT